MTLQPSDEFLEIVYYHVQLSKWPKDDDAKAWADLYNHSLITKC